MSSELGPAFYNARIVGVISDAIKEKRYVMVVGPRDVGKSLYMRLVAAKLINYSWEGDTQTSRNNIREGKKENDKYSNKSKEKDDARYFIPIFVSCEDAARMARLNYAELMYQGGKIKLEPVIFIDDAHLCKEEVEIDKGRVVRVYPTQHHMRRGKGGGDSADWFYVLPFRFVEVAELIRYPLPEIRKILSDELKHYKGEDRLKNLSNPESICKIINSLYQLYQNQTSDKELISGLDRLFRLYALYGGTAYGIELVYRDLHSALREDELSHVLSNYMKTIDEVLEDAKALGIDEVATKYLLYYLSDIGGERKGLEVNLNDMYDKVMDEVAESLGVKVERKSVNKAFSYLKDSFIVAEFSRPKEGSSKREALHKIFFTDPRYFFGAYLKRYAEEEPEHHVSAFMNKVKPCILGEKKEKCDWVSYYFEGLALLNVALGVYAMNASKYKQKYAERFDKYLKYIKYKDEKNELEIDGQFNVEERKVLFEVSMSYDENHVDKCKQALEKGLGEYCIYAFLDYRSVECKNVNDNIIKVPLPLALLLF